MTPLDRPFNLVLMVVKFTVCFNEHPHVGHKRMNLQLCPTAQRPRCCAISAVAGFTRTSICGAPASCQRVLFLFNSPSGPAEFGAPPKPQQWGPVAMGAHLYVTVFACKWQSQVESRGSSAVQSGPSFGRLCGRPEPHLETSCS